MSEQFQYLVRLLARLNRLRSEGRLSECQRIRLFAHVLAEYHPPSPPAPQPLPPLARPTDGDDLL